MFRVRNATSEDFPQIGRVMFEAVRFSDSPYSVAQREAWVPEIRSSEEMEKRLEGQEVLVAALDSEEYASAKFQYKQYDAEYQSSESPVIAGFVSLRSDGYVDMAFIRPDFQGSYGIFRSLMARLESKAIQWNLKKLTTHASLSAQPAFSALGFQTLEKESVAAGQQWLERFVMEKDLVSE